MFTHKFLSTAVALVSLSLPSAHGLLRGSNTTSTNNSIETKGRNLAESTAKTIGFRDCLIDLSSANGYDDSLVILEEDLRCPTPEFDHAIRITASRVTLDCQGHKIEETRFQSGFGLVLEGDNIVVRNCEISGFDDGILVRSSNSIVLQNVKSINNLRDGLRRDFDLDIVSSLTILSSNFDNNGANGMYLRERTRDVTKFLVETMFLFNVTANNNEENGFFLNQFSTAKFVDVEARNNGRRGRGLITNAVNPRMELVLHSSTLCGSRSHDIAIFKRVFVNFTAQAMTCDLTSPQKEDGICSCQC